MIVLEQREARIPDAVDGRQRLLFVALPRDRSRPSAARRDVLLAGRPPPCENWRRAATIMLALDLLDAEHEMPKAVLRIADDQPPARSAASSISPFDSAATKVRSISSAIARVGAAALRGRRSRPPPCRGRPGHQRGQIIADRAAADFERRRDRDALPRRSRRGATAIDKHRQAAATPRCSIDAERSRRASLEGQSDKGANFRLQARPRPRGAAVSKSQPASRERRKCPFCEVGRKAGNAAEGPSAD